MPQVQLPLFPAGSQNINPDVAFVRRDNQITYFNGQMPLFTHAADDLSSFRLFTTQLIVNGSATQDEIVKAFGVSVTAVKRCVKKYRQGGSKALFVPPRRRAGTKLDAEHLAQAQQLLDQGLAVPAISQQMGILASTLHKAIRCGRLQMGKKKAPSPAKTPRPARRGSAA
jgi:transposase